MLNAAVILTLLLSFVSITMAINIIISGIGILHRHKHTIASGIHHSRIKALYFSVILSVSSAALFIPAMAQFLLQKDWALIGIEWTNLWMIRHTLSMVFITIVHYCINDILHSCSYQLERIGSAK